MTRAADRPDGRAVFLHRERVSQPAETSDVRQVAGSDHQLWQWMTGDWRGRNARWFQAVSLMLQPVSDYQTVPNCKTFLLSTTQDTNIIQQWALCSDKKASGLLSVHIWVSEPYNLKLHCLQYPQDHSPATVKFLNISLDSLQHSCSHCITYIMHILLSVLPIDDINDWSNRNAINVSKYATEMLTTILKSLQGDLQQSTKQWCSSKYEVSNKQLSLTFL